ncbi:aminotransferase class V-fold PLP-dependent enzyme [Ascidiimonas sp. W6]|uniref:aminotransferase class V-fold PLP-dependent enzyme n=1 Tax=Ascidiimonas meishanensis TaxID=3128903 RepID=UPI0030EE881A
MDLEVIRQDTRGCENRIFLNSAGASLMPSRVVQKMKEYLSEEEMLGGYTMASQNEAQIAGFYDEVAKLIHCKPTNIAFTYNATDSFSRALSSIPFKNGDYILTTHDDYSSNEIAFLSLQKRMGVQLLKVRNSAMGLLDLNHLEELAIKYHPKLIALNHIPTNSGLIQPAEEVGEICSKLDIWYVLDACQSVGQLEVDVTKVKCDFLSVTGRKFLRGPRGTGFLYVSDKVLAEGLEPLFIDTRGADLQDSSKYIPKKTAMRFETWEYSYMSLVGLAEAIKYLNQLGIANVFEYNQKLMKPFREKLNAIKDLHVLDVGYNLSNILTFYKEGFLLDQITSLLDANKVDYTVSRTNYAAEQLIKTKVDWVIRLSPHYFNTDEELESVANILEA